MPNWSDIYSSKNSEGYHDPTVSKAFNKIERELSDDDRLRKTVTMLKNIAELAGYDVVNRIELRDKQTGRIYR